MSMTIRLWKNLSKREEKFSFSCDLFSHLLGQEKIHCAYQEMCMEVSAWFNKFYCFLYKKMFNIYQKWFSINRKKKDEKEEEKKLKFLILTFPTHNPRWALYFLKNYRHVFPLNYNLFFCFIVRAQCRIKFLFMTFSNKAEKKGFLLVSFTWLALFRQSFNHTLCIFKKATLLLFLTGMPTHCVNVALF